MYDLRESKIIELDDAECLKDNTTYKFTDFPTGKKLIAKFISEYEDADDAYLVAEFRKIAGLSGEPEIATVYYLASGEISGSRKSCYMMDFVDGDSLQKYLDARDHIAYEVLLYFTIQLASGLEKAHNFGIFHTDLHNENIIINNLGYLKLIDFLWYEYKDANGDRDLKDFKRIIDEFYLKCSDSDKPRFKIINNYCQRIKNFRGLKKEIEMLDEISFELALLSDKEHKILSKLLYHAVENTLHMTIISGPLDVPERFMPPLSDEEKEYLEIEKNGARMKLLDTRPAKIHALLEPLMFVSFYSLKQIGLIDYGVRITNSTGISFEGPYKFNFYITFTSKLLKWKSANQLLLFVEDEAMEIEDIIMA
ncbi:protein kinase domain-containing protein [Flavobacterium sp. 2]|uniref:protein kinase domain-containing protein n=1 Tax=Flavobacterium sp. 2 TaxID=308053 RepID=UPI003CED97A8